MSAEIKGAISGAIAGFAIGGPWGAAYGAVAGAVLAHAAEQAAESQQFAPDMTFEDQGLRQMTMDTQEPIKVVYGKQRVGGNTVLKHVTGTDNSDLWIVDVLAEGPCSSFSTVWLSEKQPSDYGTGNVTYWFKDGASNATVCGALNDAYSSWTDTMRYTCYMVWKFNFDRDYFISVPSRNVLLKGKKVTDYRNGWGSTATWSDNGALCLADYMTNQTYGAGFATSTIDTTSWTSVANYIDTKGWSLNMVISSMNNAGDVIDSICNHFRMRLVWYDGKWYLRYADLNNETSSMTITDDNIVQDATGRDLINISQPSMFNKPNGAKVAYIDANRNYVADSVAVGETTGIIHELRLPGCVSREQAAHIGTYNLERWQLDRSISGVFDDECAKLEPHDIVLLQSSALDIGTLGQTSTYATLRVFESSINQDGNVEIIFQYEAENLYDDDYNVDLDTVYETNLPGFGDTPPDVTNVTVYEQSYAYRLRTFTKLNVTFDVPTTYPWFDHVEVWKWKTPVGWWPINFLDGRTVYDNSEYANNGVLYCSDATAAWVTDASATNDAALEFNNANKDRINIYPSSDDPIRKVGTQDNDWSVVLWANAATGNMQINGSNCLFSNQVDDDNRFRIARRWSQGYTNVRIYYEVAGTELAVNFTDVTTFATDNTWKMLTVSYSAETQLVSCWHNTTKSSITMDLSSEEAIDLSSGEITLAGREHDGSGTGRANYFDGRLDEVKVYDVALNQKDVNQLYANKADYAREHLFNTSSDFSIANVEEDKSYRITLRPVNIWGIKRPLADSYSIYHQVVGLIDYPESITRLAIIVNANTINLYANPVDDPDVEQYEFRLGSSWSGGIVLYRALKPNMSLVGVKPGSHTFYCNTLGNNARYGTSPKSASAVLRNPPDGWAIMATQRLNYDSGFYTMNNMEAISYTSATWLKCSHSSGGTFGTLGGLFISERIDRGSEDRELVYALADIVVTGSGTDWDSTVPTATEATNEVVNAHFGTYAGSDFDSWTRGNCNASQGTMATQCATIDATAACGHIFQDFVASAGEWYRIDFDYRNYSSQAFVGLYDVTNAQWITGSQGDRRKPLDNSPEEKNDASILVQAPTGSLAIRLRLGVTASGATANFAHVRVRRIKDALSTAWEDINISTRSWTEIFELQAGPSVEMRIYYSTATAEFSAMDYVEKMEILSAIVTARYYRLWVKIVDPATSVNAYVERAAMHFTQAT